MSSIVLARSRTSKPATVFLAVPAWAVG
jgi:hypothetical protein